MTWRSPACMRRWTPGSPSTIAAIQHSPVAISSSVNSAVSTAVGCGRSRPAVAIGGLVAASAGAAAGTFAGARPPGSLAVADGAAPATGGVAFADAPGPDGAAEPAPAFRGPSYGTAQLTI